MIRQFPVGKGRQCTVSLTSRFEVDVGGRVILETVAIATDGIRKTDGLTLLLQLL